MIQTTPTPSRRARPSIRFPQRGEASRSPNAARAAALPGRIVIHPEEGPAEGIDVTRGVVGVIAAELWRLRGGNDVLNWIEAERLLIHALLAGLNRDRDRANETTSAVGASSREISASSPSSIPEPPCSGAMS